MTLSPVSPSGNAELLRTLAEAAAINIGGGSTFSAFERLEMGGEIAAAILLTLRDHGPTEEMVEAGARINAPAIIDAPMTGNRGEDDAVEEMRSHCLTEADQCVRAALTNLIEASEK